MLLCRRPAEPESFAERMRPFRQRVEEMVRAGGQPTFRDGPDWLTFKEILARAQHEKCGYCEVIVTGIGEVEHFRPKGAVSELDDDPAKWGRERPSLANVEGRRFRSVSDRGYWWLAYEWTNLRFSCATCNRWKRDLFPVEEKPRSLPPERDSPETPLLLDPYERENPSRHLRFTDLGQVEASGDSRVGFETIRTLGLDRDSLQHAREEKARRIHVLVRRLKKAEGEEVDGILRDVLEMGAARNPHAGMVRIVFEQATGLSWDDLESWDNVPSRRKTAHDDDS